MSEVLDAYRALKRYLQRFVNVFCAANCEVRTVSCTPLPVLTRP